MKQIITILVIGIIGFLGYLFFKSSKKLPETGKGVVYYYPKANIYYDVPSGQYIFFSENDKSWKQTKNFSEEQKLSLGEKAIISKPSNPIWENNAEDRIIYSVGLYSSPSDLKQKFYVDSLNSLPKTVAVPTTVTEEKKEEKTDEEKPKSGFRKFLDKIFGGNKDKTKDS
jgi:hypothetical protein